MNCEELQEMVELYALGVLEDEESTEMEAHLGRGCTTCQENLKNALCMNASLISSGPDVAPSPKLKRRILASVGVQPKGWGWLGAFATACLLVIALWLGNEERQRGAIAWITLCAFSISPKPSASRLARARPSLRVEMFSSMPNLA
jgi:hypothetical protein